MAEAEITSNRYDAGFIYVGNWNETLTAAHIALKQKSQKIPRASALETG